MDAGADEAGARGAPAAGKIGLTEGLGLGDTTAAGAATLSRIVP